MRICVIVPIYNEDAVAKQNIETILEYARAIPSTTLLVVNDGSEDSTEEVVRALLNKYGKDSIQMISHSRNRGYGAAVRTGVDFAIDNNYDYAVFMDSDLTNHPRYLKMFYEKMGEGWDYIKATRYVKGGGTIGVPFRRRFISRCGNIFARMVTGFPLTDFTNGFRAVKVDILKQLELNEDHFAIIIEELMKAKKITKKICEIPYILETRSELARPTKFAYDPCTFWKYMKYLFL